MSCFRTSTFESAHGDVETVFCRNLLGVDDNETAWVIGGIFSRWRLHDGEVVNLRTWDDVEGECPGISLRTRHCFSVHPHIVITLRQWCYGQKSVAFFGNLNLEKLALIRWFCEKCIFLTCKTVIIVIFVWLLADFILSLHLNTYII